MDNEEVTLSPTQRRVVETLKRHGDATADELADSLDITPSAVRQHLASLRSAGYVTATPERGHTGRPADRYHATNRTERLFAAPADDLAVEILEHLDDEDPALVDRIFDRRRQRLVDASREQVDDLPIAERVAAVAGDLDAQGYLADFEQTDDGDYRINLHSCPMWTVADRYRQACAAELGYVEDLVPDADVERITHKTAGAHTCTYRITPRS
jgi:predicted ArsR family transcriptional regulator